MHILKTGNNKIQKKNNKENKHSFYISVAFIVPSSLDTSASLLLSCFFFPFVFPMFHSPPRITGLLATIYKAEHVLQEQLCLFLFL